MKDFFDRPEYTVVGPVDTNKEFNTTGTFDKQQGQGLKILTPEKILSRLPISLAQLKAGNNLKELKNEIRQLLYLLYRSKKLSKAISNLE